MTLSGTMYQTTAGETFDSVSLVVYGDEKYSSDIMCANPDLTHIPVFMGDELLDLPIVEVPEDDEEQESEMPVVAPWKEE